MRLTWLTLLLCACGGTSYPTQYPDPYRQDWTNYSFAQTYVTDGGIELDDPGHQIDPAQLDATTENVNRCLSSLAPLTDAERKAGYCLGTPLYSVAYTIKVIVPDDWYVSSCSGKELFPCAVPNASCEAKGETPTTQCPCACRAIVQRNSEIVTAPNLELYPWRLVELVTGCEHQEFVPRLEACGMPDQVAR